MRKLIYVGLVLVTAGTAMFLGASPAGAVCQSFTVSAVPNPVQEGGEVTVTVSRIGTGPASVDVDGVSGTAQSGSDFEPVNRTITFTNQTAESFKVAIFDDDERENQEQFRLRLSNVKGCAADDDYSVSADEVVSILGSDAQPSSPTTGPTAAPTSRPSATSTPETTTLTTSPSPSPTVSPSPTPSASPTLTPFPTATPEADDDDGTSALAIAGILIAALAVVAGIALLLYVRRTRL